MARPPYPLEALRKLRDERVDAQAQLLATHVTRRQAAELVLKQRQDARRAQAEQTADSVRHERQRLSSGQLSGADLLREAEFETAARARADLLERAENEACRQLVVERAEEDKLRQELSRLEADAKLVRNHEANFHEHAADLALRAEEEAALEQWNARRR